MSLEREMKSIRWFSASCLLALILLPTIVEADRAGNDASDDAPRASLIALHATATPRAAHRSARQRRRRERSTQSIHPELPATTIAGATEYLQGRPAGLVASAASTSAWDQFYRWADQRIRRFAAVHLSQNADIDECTQDVWLDLARTLPSFEYDTRRGSFATWLYAVVRNKAADLSRRTARRSAISLDTPGLLELSDSRRDPASLCEQRELTLGLPDRLKSRFSDQSYRLLHMQYIQGMGVPEIATALNMTHQQVWTRQSRIRRSLRRFISESSLPLPAARSGR